MKYDIPLSDYLFQEKVLRDIHSLISDPVILNLPGTNELQMRLQKSVARFIDNDPERFMRMIARPEPRLPLGKWFERLFFTALKIAFPFADVRHSLADGQGGELDFVVIDAHITLHIEVAIKFFLHHPSEGAGLDSFLGPGGQDRLDLKYFKMKDVQLKRQIPRSLDNGNPISKILWMSGRLHCPMNSGGSSGELPVAPPLAGVPLKGYWCTPDQFLQDESNCEVFYIVPRQWWMTTLTGFTRQDLEIFEVFAWREKIVEPVMTVRVYFSADRSIEIDRGFIVAQSPSTTA